MPIPPITTFSGQLPDQNDPATFPSRADALFQWLVQNFEPEANISIAAINAALNTDATVLAALTTLQERSVVAIAADWASVASADQKKLLVFTGATTYPLPAAASAGNGFHQRIFARGGAVTVQAVSGEQVNGVQVRTIQDGENAELFCDGATWYLMIENAYRIRREFFQGGDVTTSAITKTMAASFQVAAGETARVMVDTHFFLFGNGAFSGVPFGSAVVTGTGSGTGSATYLNNGDMWFGSDQIRLAASAVDEKSVSAELVYDITGPYLFAPSVQFNSSNGAGGQVLVTKISLGLRRLSDV